MISRGEVGLIVAGYGLANGIIGRDVFSASVMMVLVTTMITPPLLRMVFPRVEGAPAEAVVEETVASIRPTRKTSAKPRVRVPLPRQTGGAHEDKTRRPARKQKYRRPAGEE